MTKNNPSMPPPQRYFADFAKVDFGLQDLA